MQTIEHKHREGSAGEGGRLREEEAADGDREGRAGRKKQAARRTDSLDGADRLEKPVPVPDALRRLRLPPIPPGKVFSELYDVVLVLDNRFLPP